jgi:hypothetical protein
LHSCSRRHGWLLISILWWAVWQNFCICGCEVGKLQKEDRWRIRKFSEGSNAHAMTNRMWDPFNRRYTTCLSRVSCFFVSVDKDDGDAYLLMHVRLHILLFQDSRGPLLNNFSIFLW